jgi:hypothetical protein
MYKLLSQELAVYNYYKKYFLFIYFVLDKSYFNDLLNF